MKTAKLEEAVKIFSKGILNRKLLCDAIGCNQTFMPEESYPRKERTTNAPKYCSTECYKIASEDF